MHKINAVQITESCGVWTLWRAKEQTDVSTKSNLLSLVIEIFNAWHYIDFNLEMELHFPRVFTHLTYKPSNKFVERVDVDGSEHQST